MKNLWILAVATAAVGCGGGSDSSDPETPMAVEAEPERIVLPPARVSIGGLEYPSLEAAAVASQPGDQIDLGEGEVVLTSTVHLLEGVSIVGAGPHLTVIAGPSTGPSIRVVPGDGLSSLSNLALDGGAIGIELAGYSLDLSHLLFRRLNVGLQATAGSVVRATHLTAIDNGLAFDVSGAVFKVSNSIVNANTMGVRADADATVEVTWSNVADNASDFAGVTAGTGCTAHAITFLDDGRETSGSLTVDAADPNSDFDQEPMDNGGRANQGAFGNTPWATTTSWVQ